jgi:hypothetical protein
VGNIGIILFSALTMEHSLLTGPFMCHAESILFTGQIRVTSSASVASRLALREHRHIVESVLFWGFIKKIIPIFTLEYIEKSN